MIVSSCQTEPKHQESGETEHEDEGHSEIVQLSQEELNEFGIELAQAGSGKLQVHVSLPGEIVIPPDNLAHIHPRFPGMVKEVKKHIGDTVREGEILAIIGPRQCGKTTLMKELFKKTDDAIFLDFEDREVLNLFNEDVKAFHSLYLKDKKVVFINSNTQPCLESKCPLINPEISAKYVLELNAGVDKEIELEVGDELDFEV